MLKLITYPAVLLTAFLAMGHINPPAKLTDHSFSAPLPVIMLTPSPASNINKEEAKVISSTAACYKEWQLGTSGLSEAAFDYAMKGFNYLNKARLIAKTNIVSIVDFSQPSTQKRLYVIDVVNGKILFNTWVAHGRNSGNEYANRFSNQQESHQSSLGFYITMGSYIGDNGYSLRLKGCEKGINDKAFERAIVIHGADYASERFISNRGSLGRSYGCPALPREVSKPIIDIIKNGSCLFLYHPTKKYCNESRILKSQV